MTEDTVDLTEEDVLVLLDEEWITIITLHERIKDRHCLKGGQEFSSQQVDIHLQNLRTDGRVEYYEEPDPAQERSLGRRQFYRRTAKGSKALKAES